MKTPLALAALAALAAAILPLPTAAAYYENEPLVILDPAKDACLVGPATLAGCAHGLLTGTITTCYFAPAWTCDVSLTLTLRLDPGVCGSAANSLLGQATGCFHEPPAPVTVDVTLAAGDGPIPTDGYVSVQVPPSLSSREDWDPTLVPPPPPACESNTGVAASGRLPGIRLLVRTPLGDVYQEVDLLPWPLPDDSRGATAPEYAVYMRSPNPC